MSIRALIRKILFENIQNFDSQTYTSFHSLTLQDLADIAQWGLTNDFADSGAWDDVKNLEEAIQNVVRGFKELLSSDFPDGFHKTPEIVPIYRMVVLKTADELNKNRLGFSWFTNPDRITNPYFKQQLNHLKGENVFLIKATTPQSNIDIPRSLFQRDMVWLENEVVLKSDSNSAVKVVSVDKIS